ncbi:subunit of tubulin prefoldin [Peltigera leucophlebia]|nr:subunit of tubulin prefoldin [Peltigera leucophlebia]
MAAEPNSSESSSIDLSTVPSPQLAQLKNQLTQDLSHLTTSFGQLRAAQIKFRECINNIRDGVAAKKEGTPILVPLTSSLYVPGQLASNSIVMVDVGTGFYVEKLVSSTNLVPASTQTTAAAREFYTQKVSELGRNLQDLEKIISSKQSNLSVVEDVLRKKLLSEASAKSDTTA